MSENAENVIVLGASNKPDRYSYKAIRMLKEYGHKPFPVHPSLPEVDGIAVSPKISSVNEPVQTLTVYVNPQLSSEMQEEILSCKASRFIFNPGTENPELEEKLRKAGKEVVEACTLVLLRTGQF